MTYRIIETAPREYMDCGEAATRLTADGVPLCDGDWAELVRLTTEGVE